MFAYMFTPEVPSGYEKKSSTFPRSLNCLKVSLCDLNTTILKLSKEQKKERIDRKTFTQKQINNFIDSCPSSVKQKVKLFNLQIVNLVQNSLASRIYMYACGLHEFIDLS